MPDTATPNAPALEGADASDAAIWEQLRQEEAAEGAKPPAEPDSDAKPATEAEKPPTSDLAPAEPAADAEKNKQATNAAGDDIWKDAPPALKEAYGNLKADHGNLQVNLKRTNGVVSALTKKSNALAAEVETLKKPAPAKSATERREGEDEPETDEVSDIDPDLQELAREFPEVVAPLAKVLAKREAALRDELRPLQAARAADDTALQLSVVDAAHPDYDEAVASREFFDWYKAAPRYVQNAVERNGKGVVDGQEVADLTARFKADTGWKSTAARGAATTKPAAAAATDPKRAAQLESAGTSRGTRGAHVTTDAPPAGATNEEIWEYWKRKDEEAAAKAKRQ